MHILVIDDEKDLVTLISRALKEDSHAVDTSYDGQKGEDLALSESYDLIILDIMLPKKDGLVVLSTLREEGITTPVLLLTARDEVADRVVGLDAGADDYLGKPFAVAELHARVRALLRRHSENKSPVLSVGNLSMDIVGHDVRIGKSRIELTSREFAVLEYFMRNKGRLVTKGMIAEHVWDFEFNSDYNLIEVYINRLRQKIEHYGGKRLIHTIRNSGYVMREP